MILFFATSLNTDSILVPDLTEPIDVYSEWIDAADAAQAEIDADDARRMNSSGSRSRQRAEVSDDE